MRAHYLQHVSFEGLGSIESWLVNAGYEISSTPLYSSTVFPDIESIDFLVVMGGPMSVNDEAEYPWLAQEKDFIKQAIDLGIPVLGICLGAQLIADTMGAKVFPNTVKEIGWFPITAVNSETSSTFQFPKEIDVFHWHGETFSLPEGAVQIAKSQGCENQAFQLGSHVIGLQFHLETTPISAQALVSECRNELVAGEYIQSEAEILAAVKESYTSINSLMTRVLEYLHEAR